MILGDDVSAETWVKDVWVRYMCLCYGTFAYDDQGFKTYENGSSESKEDMMHILHSLSNHINIGKTYNVAWMANGCLVMSKNAKNLDLSKEELYKVQPRWRKLSEFRCHIDMIYDQAN